MNHVRERVFLYDNQETGLVLPVFLSMLLHALIASILYLLIIIFSPYIVKPDIQVKDLEFTIIGEQKQEIIKEKPVIIQKKLKQLGTTEVKKERTVTPNRVNSYKTRESGNRNSKTNRAASQNRLRMSDKPHKGRLAKATKPNSFSMPMPDIDALSNDIGFGTDGTPGYTSHHSSSTPIISTGDGEKGTGNSNLSGKGIRKGGGYYGSNAGSLTGKSLQGKAENQIQKGADFNTYISELQRRIKRNWNPPDSDFKITLILRIAKNGNLLSVHSRNPEYADASKSAINAVNRVFPYKQLPVDYRDNYLVISFTFDSSSASVYR